MKTHLKQLGFRKRCDRYYHDKLDENYLKYESYDKKGKGWYFNGTWEHLNKTPIKNKEHLINFVKYTFGVEL